MVIGLCDRFGKLPSEVERESTEILRLLYLIHRASPDWAG